MLWIVLDSPFLRLPIALKFYERAFTDPAAMAVWLAPGDMTGEVHSFDDRVGGGYQMSLYYPSSETTYITRLRKKLGAPGEKIVTVWGVGYRFVS